MTTDTDRTNLLEAYRSAVNSPDPSNQNGALILFAGDGHPFPYLTDCNRFPTQFKFTAEHTHCRELKYRYIEHAERNAVYDAARMGLCTQDATMYCPWFACMECARAIIQAGITQVVGHKQRMDLTPERWKANVDEALEYLKSCEVKMRFFDGEIGGPKILVEGQPWQP